MSTPTRRNRRRARPRNSGLPTWSGIAIVLAALVTGLLLSINAQAIGIPYLLCFGVAAVLVALFTEARGIFLTVASLPFLFGVMTVISAWTVNRVQAPAGTPAFSTTSIVTAAFPLAQYFPFLLSMSAATTAIGLLRVWLLRRSGRARDNAEIVHRRHYAEADRRNRATASRARRRTNQVTVEELLARNRARTDAGGEPPVRRARPPRREAPPRAAKSPVQPPATPRTEPRVEPRRPDPAPRSPRSRRLDDDLYS